MVQQTFISRARTCQIVWKSSGRSSREDHIRHRDDSPTLGRFIERDPIGFEAGENNWYRFVVNGPTGTTDPRGLCSGCTQVEMDNLMKQIRDRVKQTRIWDFQVDSCQVWMDEFEKNLKGFPENPCLKDKHIDWEPSNAIGGGHAVYRFDVCGGQTVTVDHWFYYGGSRVRIFTPPSIHSPEWRPPYLAR